MSLYRAELRRLTKRRMARYLSLAAALVLVAVVVFVFEVNDKRGPEAAAQAARTAEEMYRTGLASAAESRAQCEQAKKNGTREQQGFPADCAEITPADRSAYTTEQFLPRTFVFRKQFGTTLTVLAGVLAMVALAVGASFVGAEWTTGGMSTLLLWRPNRRKVLATKLAALSTGAVALAAAFTVVWTVAMWVVAVVHGDTTGVTGAVWGSLLLTAVRGVILVAVAGAVGFALASLGRGTALALGGVLGVGVVGQTAVGFLAGMAGVDYPDLWLLPTYLVAWMDRDFTAIGPIPQSCQLTGQNCAPVNFHLLWPVPGVIMAVLVTVLVGAAMWVIHRRDVS
jgi:hypothetical protein